MPFRVKNCFENDIEQKKCILNNEEILLNENKEDEFVNNIEDYMKNGNYNLTKIKEGEEIQYKGNKASYTLSTTEKLKNNNNNSTTIDLGDCELKIKEYYNISKKDSLYIFLIKVYEKYMKIPKLEYEIFYPFNGNDLVKLDLSLCKDIKIDISIPVTIEENNLDKHNSSSRYYNDICYTYTSEKGTDITLKDRKKEYIEKNYTLCEEDCKLTGYDSNTKKALCSCEVKIKLPLISEISFDKNKLYNNFANITNIANMKVMKCYNVLFTKKGVLNNIGCYIIIPIIILHFLSIIIFYSKDYKELQNIINEICQFLKYKHNTDIKKDNKDKHKRRITKNKTEIKNIKRVDKYKKLKIIENAGKENNCIIIESNKIKNKNNNNLEGLNKNNKIKINNNNLDKIAEVNIKSNEQKKNEITGKKIEEPLFIKYLKNKEIKLKIRNEKNDLNKKNTNFPPIK